MIVHFDKYGTGRKKKVEPVEDEIIEDMGILRKDKNYNKLKRMVKEQFLEMSAQETDVIDIDDAEQIRASFNFI